MPIQYSEDQLKKDISSGSFAPVYILFGDDAYLKKHYTDRICDKAYGGDSFFNLQKFEGETALQNVYDAVNQFPMMADRKCVVLTDYDFEHADKADYDKLCELLSSSQPECVLLLRFDSVEVDPKHSSKAKGIISAAEKNGGRIVALNHRKPFELVKMLVKGAEKRGCRFEEKAAKLLVETAGEDINLLVNELEKLCAYVGDGTIGCDTVELVCTKSVEASVYDLTRLIFSCDLTRALSQLNDMFFMRIEPITIFYIVSAAFVDAYRVYAGAKAKTPNSELARLFGYKNRAFVLDKAAASLQRLDEKRFVLCFDALLQADRSLKSFGFDPNTVLEELTVRLVYIIAGGE